MYTYKAESRKHILTNYNKVRNGGGKAIDTDHFTEYMDVELEVTKEKPERQEVFNFKDKESQELFKVMTSETEAFTDCFDNKIPLLQNVENWRKILNSFCKKSFKKIRIKKNQIKPVDKAISSLIDKRNSLVRSSGEEDMIESIDTQIADIEASNNREKIMKNFQFYSQNPENIQMQKMWKILKNICPKLKPTLPTAKRNHKGKIVSGKYELKNLLAQEYKNRLRTRPMRKDYKSIKIRRKKIFEMKMMLAKSRKSPPWTMQQLETALGDLKRNKSRDYEGYINEIFKKDVIGSNLKASLLKMLNSLKKETLIPQFLNCVNITTVPKKGSRLEPKNERGIFRVPIVRYILMRLIYNSKYSVIDENMSDSQMGARKGKGCKSNIWIINGIIHETLHGKNKKPVLLQIYDYAQMFDSINLEEALADIYDFGVDDENLALIHKANDEVHMSVKTPGGLTDRQVIKNIVLQGDTFGSILASVQVDAIAKDVEEAGLGYKYKQSLEIGILGLVDDLIGITEAGHKAQQMNVILNVKSAEKCLQFGVSKCKSMLIGGKANNLINSDLKVDCWKEEYVESIETGETQLIDKYLGEVSIEKTTEHKYLGFIVSSEGNNMANIMAMKKKSHGVIRTIMDKLEKLNLRNYYFECSIIFMNVMLRGSILYGSETYYNLTEGQLRCIERIEETYMRKILNTKRSCPIIQMYLELGQWPARFEVQKSRLLFLKSILDEDENSRVVQFFKLQLEQPCKGDWVSRCKKDLKELGILESFDVIKNMSKQKYKKMLKLKIKENAWKYLIGKRGSKGKEIEYSTLEMADYLSPYSQKLSIVEKQKVFSIRNRMVEIPYNYGNSEELCICGDKENMSHIYSCKKLNKDKFEISFENIYTRNLYKQFEVFTRFEENMNRRNKFKLEVPGDQNSDPLSCNQSSFG